MIKTKKPSEYNEVQEQKLPAPEYIVRDIVVRKSGVNKVELDEPR